MRCNQCHKNVRSISHWAREHKAWLKSRPRVRRKAPHHRGSRRESTKSFAEHHTAEIEKAVAAYPEFCPACGHNPCRYRGK